MIQSLYLDTSVFGGHYDEEFSEHTNPLFKRIANGEFKILFSTVTQEELEFAPENISVWFKTFKLNRRFSLMFQMKQLS